MKVRLATYLRNWVSLVGAMIALISLFMIAFLFVVTVFWGKGGVYLGLVTYILLPGIMISGLILIPVGMVLQARREKRLKRVEEPGWPRVDLNNPKHRNAFFTFSAFTAIFLLMSAVGSYKAFHFTETVQFCGKLCHTVMKPEYTAYQRSPHARVVCVECHVGPGADWYVRSKLSGLYQVYATLANAYPRPIPTPIKSLRPAREVCEQCHWPQKFYAYKLRLETHYLPDEKNTRWDIQLIMKIGAKHPALGLREGIHWHINPDVKIEYIATDKQREEIPWVRYTNLKTGETVVYQDKNNPLNPKEISKLEVRTMDCMDCHNRPSHDFQPPSKFINTAMTAGRIPTTLPNLKAVSLDLCAKEYPSTRAALKAISDGINDYYKKNYPEIYAKKKTLIAKAIKGLQGAFSHNIFPEMKVRWSVHPNNLGHLESKGCFRCHNGTHVSDKGRVIGRDCNLCHTIIAQGKPGKMEEAPIDGALEFKHPVDIDEEWKESFCNDCHTGLNP